MPSGVGTGNIVGEAWLRLNTAVDTSGAQSGLAGLSLMAGKTAAQIGRVFGAYAGAAGLAIAIKSSTNAFIEFDRALKNSWTLVNETNAAMQKSGEEARSMARQYHVGSIEAEKALYQIWSATFYGSDSMEILEQSTRGAAAGLSDLMSTADMVTTVLNAYGKSASESAHINDLLFTAVRFGKVTYGELANQFGRLAGVAAPTGASLEDMVAAIATLTRQGIEADWAVTSLRQTLMQFIKPTKNLKSSIEDLGYTSGSAMIKANGFAKSIRMITEWAEENNIEMNQMFTNVRAVTAILPLATTAAAGFALDQQRMADSAGQASLAFEKQTQSIQYQLARMKTLFGDLAISVGQTFIPALMSIVKAFELIAPPLRIAFDLFNKLGGGYMIAVASTLASISGAVWVVVKAFKALNAVLVANAVIGVAGGWKSVATGKFIAPTILQQLLSRLTAVGGSALAGLGIAGVGAMGIGASIKGLINIDWHLGEVMGLKEVAAGIGNSLMTILGAGVGGAVAGVLLGGAGAALTGGLIGVAVAGAAITIKLVHDVYVHEAEKREATLGEARGIISENVSILPFEIGATTQNLTELLIPYARELTNLNSEYAKSKNAVAIMIDALEEMYESVHDTSKLWSPRTGYQLKGYTEQMHDVRNSFSDTFDQLIPSIEQLNNLLNIMSSNALDIYNVTGNLITEDQSRLALMNKIAVSQQKYNDVIKESGVDVASFINRFESDVSNLVNTIDEDMSISGIPASGKFEANIHAVENLVEGVNKAFGNLPEDLQTEEIKKALVYQVYSGLADAGISQEIRDLFIAGLNITEGDLVQFLINAISKASITKPESKITIHTQFEEAEKRWKELYEKISEGNITIEKAKEIWSELTSISDEWASISTMAINFQWEGFDEIIAKVEEWAVLLASISVDSWSDQVKALGDILTDSESSVEKRYNAESELISLYGELTEVIETTKFEDIAAKARAAMAAIEALGISTGALGNVAAQQAKNFFDNARIWIDAFVKSEKGSYAQLIARGELSAILAQAEAIKEKFVSTGKAVPENIKHLIQQIHKLNITISASSNSWGNQVATLSGILESGTTAVEDRSDAEQSLIALYSQLKEIAETSKYPEIISAARQAMADIEALGLKLPTTIKESILEPLLNIISSISSMAGKAGGSSIGYATSIGSSLISGDYIQAGLDVIDMGITLADELYNNINGIIGTFNNLAESAISLARSFAGLITQSDAYGALQDNLNRILQIFRNALASFLWPLVAIAEELGLFVGATSEATTTIETETAERLRSLNIPIGYKVTRAEWRAAIPGQPPMPVESGGGGSGGGEYTIPDWAKNLIAPFMSIIGEIGDGLKVFLDAISFMAQEIAGPFLEAVLTVLSSFVEPLKGLSAWIKETLTPDLVSFFGSFSNWWKKDVDPFLQKQLFPQLGEWGGALYEWIKSDFLPFLKNTVWPFLTETLWPQIVEGVNSLGSSLSDLWNIITEDKDTISQLIQDFIDNTFSDLIGAIETFSAYLQTESGDLMGGLKTIWESESLSLWDKLKISFGLGAIALWDWLEVELQPLWVAFGKLWEAISPVLIPTLQVLAALLAGAFKFAIDMVSMGLEILAFAIDLLLYPFKVLAVIVYNLYVAIHNAIQYVLNLLDPFSSGNQLEYKPLPALAEGGRILTEGAAYLHANEIVVPAQTSPLALSGGMVIDNTIVLDGDVLWRGMKKANQRQERRKTGSSVGTRAWVSA